MTAREKLVTIIEVKRRGSKEDVMERLGMVKREVTAAISTSHGLSVSDLVLVSPGAIPITTSGKVRRAECVEAATEHGQVSTGLDTGPDQLASHCPFAKPSGGREGRLRRRCSRE